MSHCLIKRVTLQNEFFRLVAVLSPKKTEMTMSVLVPIFNTNKIPKTTNILNKELPSIFYSRCINENYLPFSQEVKHTEVGHLFEHILLEYLTETKFIKDNKKTLYSGVTSWNWYIYKTGVFQIKVNAGLLDEKVFKEALAKSIKLINKIIESGLKDQKNKFLPERFTASSSRLLA